MITRKMLTLALAIVSLACGTAYSQNNQADKSPCSDEHAAISVRINACTKIIELSSVKKTDLGISLTNRGSAYLNNYQYDLALKDFSRAIAIDPKYPRAFSERAVVYASQGKFDLAMQDASHAINLDSNYYQAYVNRGVIYMWKRDFAMALKDFSHAIALNPNDAGIYADRSIIYNVNGKYNLALQDLNIAFKLNPNQSGLLNDRGITYNNLGKYDLAIQDFDAALKQAGSDPEKIFTNRCGAYAHLGKLHEALLDCNAAIGLNSSDIAAFGNRGFTYLRMKQFDHAISDFDMAIKGEQRSPFLLYGRGFAKTMKGDKVGGHDDIATALHLDPGVAKAYKKYGLIPD